MVTEHGKCRLCLKSKDLRESHIIPRLLAKKIKVQPSKVYTVEDGVTSKRFSQDTQKEYLLCDECEKKLNVFETYYTNSFNFKEYTSELYTFLLSIVWRVIECYYHKRNIYERNEFDRNVLWKEAARAYLDQEIIPDHFPSIYLFYLKKGSKYDFLMHAGTYFSDMHKCNVSLYHRFIDGFNEYDFVCERNESNELSLFVSIPHDIDGHPVSIQNIFFIENRQILLVVSEDLITCIALDGEKIPLFSKYEIDNANGVIQCSNTPEQICIEISNNLCNVNKQTVLLDETIKICDSKIEEIFKTTSTHIQD